MKVTPLELKKADFKRVLRGYDTGDVGDLLAAAAETLEDMVRENRNLKEKQNLLGERLKSYESMEKALNDTLITAQKSGDATRRTAEREAELIVAKAEVQAEKLVEESKSELKRIRYQIEMQQHEKEAFLVKMRSLVASQWKILQEDFEPRRSMLSDPEQTEAQQALGQETTAPASPENPVEASPEQQLDSGPPADEEPEIPGMGDLSGHLGKILGSGDEETPPEGAAPADEGEEGDSGSPGDDKLEVFWGDDSRDEKLEGDRENK